MIFFTSDTHFNHGNCIKYCNRPFSTSEEMDKAMTDNWNSVVTDKDTIYHLGDFSFKSDPGKYTSRLNGRKVLIRGNHDKRDDYKKYFSEVYDLLNLTIEKQPVTLCHYAMRVWNRSHYGAISLYGHSHGHLPSIGKSYDVGVDANNFTPVSWEQIKEIMKDKETNLTLKKEIYHG